MKNEVDHLYGRQGVVLVLGGSDLLRMLVVISVPAHGSSILLVSLPLPAASTLAFASKVHLYNTFSQAKRHGHLGVLCWFGILIRLCPFCTKISRDLTT